MAAQHTHFARGGRCQNATPLPQCVFVLFAAFLVLGVVLGGIGFFNAPVSGAAGYVSGGPAPVEQSQRASRIPVGPAQRAVDVVPSVQAPGRITTVGLAELSAPVDVDWDKTKTMRTVDTDPGGTFNWDRKTGRVRVCDRNKDGHVVRGRVTVDGREVVYKRAGENGKCYEADIPDYKATDAPKYHFEICLARSDEEPDGYCNTSNNAQWPRVDHKNNYCWHLSTDQEKIDCVGGVQEYCHQWQHVDSMFPDQCVKDHTKKSGVTVPKPPTGRTPSINDRPDEDLRRGPDHATGVSKVTKPVGILLRWVLWGVLGACVMGFMLVGGNMAIKHKRGEAGAHVTGMFWVLIATVVAGSGLAIGLISLLIDPL